MTPDEKDKLINDNVTENVDDEEEEYNEEDFEELDIDESILIQKTISETSQPVKVTTTYDAKLSPDGKIFGECKITIERMLLEEDSEEARFIAADDVKEIARAIRGAFTRQGSTHESDTRKQK